MLINETLWDTGEKGQLNSAAEDLSDQWGE